jgi:uncharacterized membrane protein
MSKNPFNLYNQFEQFDSNTESLNLNNIRDKIKNLVEKFLNKFFEDKFFEVGEKQEWINNICNGIIKEISEILNGFKIICVGYIVQKGNAPFFFDSNCLWDKKTDSVVTVQYENNFLHCFCCVFITIP